MNRCFNLVISYSFDSFNSFLQYFQSLYQCLATKQSFYLMLSFVTLWDGNNATDLKPSASTSKESPPLNPITNNPILPQIHSFYKKVLKLFTVFTQPLFPCQNTFSNMSNCIVPSTFYFNFLRTHWRIV